MNTNLMIAGTILDFVLNGLMGDSKSSVPQSGPDNFDSLIKQSLLNTGETNNALNIRALKSSEKDLSRPGVYLEALNKGLVARGKSTDKAYLKSNDINMLSDFLLQCGYTEADAKQFIGSLLEKHPDGMIPLSEFFSQVCATETSGKKPYQSIIMDPSVTTRFDSILKDLGLTLEETNRTLNAARAVEGGLDLDKLVAQLKTARDRMSIEKRGASEGIPSAGVLTKLEELGIQIQPGQTTGRIPMDDLITGLEQLKDRINARGHGIENGFLKEHNLSGTDSTGRGYDGRLTWKIVQTGQENPAGVTNSASQLPLDVKSSIDRIIERSVAVGEKLELHLAGPSILQLKSASSAGNKKNNGSRNDGEGDHMSVPVKNNGKPLVDGGSLSMEGGRQEKLDRISDINGGSVYKKDTITETKRDDVKTKAVEILQEGAPAVRFETVQSIPRNRQADNSFFSEHIVDQLGKQISRSVLRGDRIINLQLNPPELGAVKLSMEIKGNTLQLGMITESSSVKEIMLASAHELRSALLDQGIKLGSLDIQVGQNFGRSLMNLNGGQGQEHQQYQETNGDLFTGNEIQEDVLPGPRNMAERIYLLNLKA